ncbi:hypothetical protein Mp_4g16090 [Marchantia polymorpha subsp. ruderalis]|uniref:Uncharacterized protein n=2 Tax=Marchantia polymorpha TaxID=3197 RepID=A0AAF6BAE1_MARPO|nr:hypothetical protein MARPO_0054s0074 [Marchantia polymorpha]BBN08975.1 hypothetical protein Mp_4g16090 [Marchantia polymorpha subsp. ruderalis]|eukprot:PTQ37965.1 hypothetical protein MARPO_0054s0074 [Marchantia polymorpha]
MREVGVESHLPASDLGYSFGHSVTHKLCQEWLLQIELDLTNSRITYGAVKWAISELQRMEDNDWYSGDDSVDRGSSSSRSDDVGEWNSGSSRLPSDSVNAGWGRDQFSAENGVEGARIDLVDWRNLLIAAGGCREEPDHGDLNNEGDRRARVTKFSFSSALKEALIAAEGGKAGGRMAERINSRFELPECVFLTKLVSQCLLVSLDQTPSSDTCAALTSARNEEPNADWMWLHRWFVRTLIPGAGSDSCYDALDWLVAHMTASRGTITKLVLDDLLADLSNFNEGDEQPRVATYIRRTGVLEYAALRNGDEDVRLDVVLKRNVHL